jgi:hypothetical protein
VQVISNAQRFCPLAATELIHYKNRAADSTPLIAAINRSLVADIRPTHNTFFVWLPGTKLGTICSAFFVAIATSRTFYDYAHATQNTENRRVPVRKATSLIF